MRPKRTPRRAELSRARTAAVVLAAYLCGCAHSVKIITVPEGAAVTVDGKPMGNGPVLLNERSGAPGRSREVRVQLPGYPPLAARETVRICPTPANLLLDLLAVGFLVGFCMKDEYVYDLTQAQFTPGTPKPVPVR